MEGIARVSDKSFHMPLHRLVLFDGDCDMCTWSARVVYQNDSRRGTLPLFRIASLKKPEGQTVAKFYNVPDEFRVEMKSMVVIEPHLDGTYVVRSRSDAVLAIAAGLQWPYPLLGALRVLPRPVLDALYNFVAANRYRLFSPNHPTYLFRGLYQLLGWLPSPKPPVLQAAADRNAGLPPLSEFGAALPEDAALPIGGSCPMKTATDRNADMPAAELQRMQREREREAGR